MLRLRLGLGHRAASHWKRSTLGAERALHRSVLQTRWLCRSRFSVIIPWRQLSWYAHGTKDFSGVSTYVENKAAQTSASWLSGGPFQRQIVLQAAPRFGQPQPIAAWAALAGHNALVLHIAPRPGCSPPRSARPPWCTGRTTRCSGPPRSQVARCATGTRW